jgi:REP element-mobilizing transposase RayT
MPRSLRIDGPGLIHHVTVRGVERRDIFIDDEDRWDMVRRLSRLIPELGFLCFGWVFMSNHIHLVLQTGVAGLPKLMARLGTGYALAFNRRHGRVGHLWQDRYWSRPIEEDLETVVAYVHANPERAGLVHEERGDRYPWSGNARVVGLRRPFPFERRVRGDLAWPSMPAVSLAASESDRLEELVRSVCVSRGVSFERLRSGLRTSDVASVRVDIARTAVVGMRISQRAVAEALCVNGASVSRWLRT